MYITQLNKTHVEYSLSTFVSGFLSCEQKKKTTMSGETSYAFRIQHFVISILLYYSTKKRFCANKKWDLRPQCVHSKYNMQSTRQNYFTLLTIEWNAILLKYTHKAHHGFNCDPKVPVSGLSSTLSVVIKTITASGPNFPPQQSVIVNSLIAHKMCVMSFRLIRRHVL